MQDLEILQLILATTNDNIYLSDIDTYKIYYINDTLLKSIGNPSEEIWRYTPCYKLLQGMDSPCPFCTNSQLKEDSTVSTTLYNNKFNLWFTHKDRKICYNGLNIRLGIMSNVDEIMKNNVRLHDVIEEEQILLDCISLLHSQNQYDESINKLLVLIATFHDADRTFIYDIDYDNNVICNIVEWTKNNIPTQISKLQCIDLSLFDFVLDSLKANSTLSVFDVEREINKSKYVNFYYLLHDNNVNSLLIVPIKSHDGKIISILGVDNPHKRINARALLTPISFFVADFKEKQKMLNQLHNLSYTDSITSLKNTHCYRIDIDNYENNLPKSCGIAFIDINGLKEINDNLGHQAGDKVIKQLGFLLLNQFREHAYRTGGDEFVVIVPNCNKDEFMDTLTKLQEKIDVVENLKVATGSLWTDDFSEGIKKHIQIADNEMYVRKREFYSKRGFDRRKR